MPSWGSELGLRAGAPSWDSELGLRAGTRSWDSELGLRAGTPSWDSELGLRAGTPSWDSELGTPSWSSVVSGFRFPETAGNGHRTPDPGSRIPATTVRRQRR